MLNKIKELITLNNLINEKAKKNGVPINSIFDSVKKFIVDYAPPKNNVAKSEIEEFTFKTKESAIKNIVCLLNLYKESDPKTKLTLAYDEYINEDDYKSYKKAGYVINKSLNTVEIEYSADLGTTNFKVSTDDVDKYYDVNLRDEIIKDVVKIITLNNISPNETLSEFKEYSSDVFRLFIVGEALFINEHYQKLCKFNENKDSIDTSKDDIYMDKPSLLTIASYFGCHPLIDYLIKEGVDVTYKTGNNKTVLDYFRPNFSTTPEEISIIKSKLDGTYENGKYKTMYEQKFLNSSIPEITKINSQTTLKI